MLDKKRNHPKEKTKLHPRSKHRERYDFKLLISSYPELAQFVILNAYQDQSIDFFNPEAVKSLNKALLKHYYGITDWDIPQNYLCPPIPGRADYIHHIADLLYRENPKLLEMKTLSKAKIRCLDIGVGSNCIYPIIGIKEYGWSFVGTDIDPISLKSASQIIQSNSILKRKVELRLQSNPENIFNGIIQKDEFFDLTICNPPFHTSSKDAESGTRRKLKNLNREKLSKPILNFGGKSNELWCEGGEEKFVQNMIFESKQFSTSCFWFSTLISKQSNLKNAYKILNKMEAVEVKTIPMGQGNKISRILAWTFFARILT